MFDTSLIHRCTRVGVLYPPSVHRGDLGSASSLMSSPLEPNISRQNPEKRNKNIFMDDFIEQSEEARTNNAMQV